MARTKESFQKDEAYTTIRSSVNKCIEITTLNVTESYLNNLQVNHVI